MSEHARQKAIILKKHVISSLTIHLADVYEAVISWSRYPQAKPPGTNTTYQQAREAEHAAIKRMIVAQELALFRLEKRIPTLLRSREAVERAVHETSAVVGALKRHIENAKLRYKYDHKRGTKVAEKATKEYAAAQCALDGEQEALRTMRDTLAEEYLPSIHDKYDSDSEGSVSHAGVDHDQSTHSSNTGSDPAPVTPVSLASHADTVTVLSPTQEAGTRDLSEVAEDNLLESALEKLPNAPHKRPRDEDEVETEVETEVSSGEVKVADTPERPPD